MFVPPFESALEHQQYEHAQEIQGRAQDDLNPHRPGAEPRSQRDMFEHEHDLGEDQGANQHQ